MYKTKILQLLFIASLFWASVVIWAEELERLFSLLPGSGSNVLHYMIELMIIIIIIGFFYIVQRLIFKSFPGFLKIPDRTSNLSLFIGIILYTPLVFALLCIIIFSFWWAFVVSGEDHTHSQYGLSAWFVALFYSIALTPMSVILCLWSSVREG